MKFSLKDLNPQQLEAVTHEGGPILVLAGAGTGKTRTITARIAWLISQGVDTGSMLALTFTNKAAREMRDRIGGMVERCHARMIQASTFHSLCVKILRADIGCLGYPGTFSIIDEADGVGLIKKVINRVTSRDERVDAQLARNFISRMKNTGLGLSEDEGSILAAVYEGYERELRALNALDFDDLLLRAVEVLEKSEEARAKWQARALYLLVDEFQDTNSLQMRLVKLLAYGERPEVCVVGDDDQSIYGWRGAEISNILEFERYFPKPKVVRLERNYRSKAPILEAANRLINHNPKRRPKRLLSMSGGGEPVRLLSVPDERRECDFVIEQIQRERDRLGAVWEDFAVLFRMNGQARIFEETLRREKIPYRLVGAGSFYDRREVRDFIAYLTVLNNPEADFALLRMVGNPPQGIGPGTIDLALAYSAERGISLYRAFGEEGFLDGCSRKVVAAIRGFREKVNAARGLLVTGEKEPVEILEQLLNEVNYFDYLKRTCKTPEEMRKREECAREFICSFGDYLKFERGGLGGFLDSVVLDRERDDEEAEKGRGVTLITIHAAKGLEFPHVFLVGAEDGILPHLRSKEEGLIEEERRLFYVGITRAMRVLWVTWCRQRMKYGSAVECRPSPFLREIIGEGVEEECYEELISRPMEAADVAAQFAALRASLAKGRCGGK